MSVVYLATLPTITRAQLVEAAEMTLDEDISPDLAAKVREVARTVEYITADWVEDESDLEFTSELPPCGCLIGTIKLRQGISPEYVCAWADSDQSSSEELSIAVGFISALHEATGRQHATVFQRFRVIDEEKPADASNASDALDELDDLISGAGAVA